MPRLGETLIKPSLIVYHRQERQRRKQAPQREKGEGRGIFILQRMARELRMRDYVHNEGYI
jgi:hypothetical protein